MKTILITILLLFSFSYSYSQENLVQWLEGKISSSHGIEGEFTQKTFQGNSKTPEVYSGNLIAYKPFNSKINYTKPFEQTLYITKERVILYTPSEKQAIISKRDTEIFIEDVMAIFLNTKPIRAVFDIQVEGSKLMLKPKSSSDMKNIEITVKNDTIQNITMIDIENNKVEIMFKTFRFLTKKENINFEIPTGTKIINY
ncbi:MAG: outer-membrane lipoprotein carrier protein LolA [Hydrogenothermaceae bacterium]|nr:outer-membrane lipoprotein carrier protein LolA [Hydrogenothermaceae bacterium]